MAAGLSAATAFGVGSAVQHDEAAQLDVGPAFDPGLLTRLVRRPLWLLGTAADVLAVGLQAVALRFGPVALVQLLVVGGLPIAVLLSALRSRVPPPSRQLLGLVLCTAGLACAVPASSTVGLGHPAGRGTWIAALSVAAIIVAGLLASAQGNVRLAPPAYGLAAGIAAGTSSVLLAVCSARFGNVAGLLTSAPPYAAVGTGLLALLLTQQAFQTGALGVPLAALSVAEPVVAVALAVAVLHQRLPTAASVLVVGGVGVVAAVAGVVLLADRSAAAEALAGSDRVVSR